MHETKTRIDINLLAFRRVLGMSAKELGDALGYSRQMINNIESGRSIMHRCTELSIIGWLYQRNKTEPFDDHTAELIRACFEQKVIMEFKIL